MTRHFHFSLSASSQCFFSVNVENCCCLFTPTCLKNISVKHIELSIDSENRRISFDFRRQNRNEFQVVFFVCSFSMFQGRSKLVLIFCIVKLLFCNMALNSMLLFIQLFKESLFALFLLFQITP